MARYVAMIPARLGSKRVKKKNLRLLGEKPLIAYAIEVACASRAFDEVYVNSESGVFKEIAERYGAKFYQRPVEFSTDHATNDGFAKEFMDNVMCDVLVQINPTSPFIGVEDIQKAKALFEQDGYDTVLSVKELRIEGLLKNTPLNFNPKQQMPPSQDLEPLYVFCNGILAWRTAVFLQNMKEYGCAVYGGEGKTGYCVLSGDATLDIDEDSDFSQAELVLERRRQRVLPARYWDCGDSPGEHSETTVGDILKKDGVAKIDLEDVNHEITNIPKLLSDGSNARSWSKRIINSRSNCVTLISQMPGDGNRLHYHYDWDEWWFILEGEWEYEVEEKIHRVSQGDVVFIERNRLHKVTAKGASRAVRMAVSFDGVAHVYPAEEETV